MADPVMLEWAEQKLVQLVELIKSMVPNEDLVSDHNS